MGFFDSPHTRATRPARDKGNLIRKGESRAEFRERMKDEEAMRRIEAFERQQASHAPWWYTDLKHWAKGGR